MTAHYCIVQCAINHRECWCNFWYRDYSYTQGMSLWYTFGQQGQL